MNESQNRELEFRNFVDSLDRDVLDAALKANFFILIKLEGFSESVIVPLLKKEDGKSMEQMNDKWLRDMKKFVADFRKQGN